MMKFVRTVTALAIVTLGTSAGGASVWQSSVDSNRLPNSSDKHRYPRWLPLSLIDVSLDTQTNALIPNCAGGKMAVDRRNVAHIVTGVTGKYYSSAHDSRKSNGFSQAESIIPNPDTIDTSASGWDMTSGPPPSGDTDQRDIVHLVYAANAQAPNPPNNTIKDLWYRRRTATGWGGRTNITNTPTTPDTTIQFGTPAIVVDGNGTLHVVASHLQRYWPPSQGEPTFTYRIYHVTINSAGSVGSSEFYQPANYDLGAPQIAFGANLHLMWLQRNNPGDTVLRLKHAVKISGSWTLDSSDVVNGSGAAEPGFPDMAVDPVSSQSDDDVHFVWTDSGTLKYRKRANGTYQGIEAVSTLSGAASGEIAVDGQHQPHVVWSGTDGKFCYAGRIFNPNPIGPDPWIGRQEPSKDLEDFGVGQLCRPSELVANKNGGLFVFGTSGHYGSPAGFTRSIEFNLGEQDPTGMVAVGPGARANLTNGNLLMDFPLFSSKGAGLSTTMSLIWNSQHWEPSPISQGWSHNYHIYLVDSKNGIKDIVRLDPNTSEPKTADLITLFLGDGRCIPFKWKDTGEPNAKYHVAFDEFGYFARIERDTPLLQTTYTLTTKVGVQYKFRNDGRLDKIIDTKQNEEQLTYSGTNPPIRLTTISDTMNRATNLVYDAEGKLDKVTTAKDGVEYKLDYDTAKKLSTLTINNQGIATEKPIWRFEYHASDDQGNKTKVNLISKVTTPFPADFLYHYFQDNRFEHSQDPTLTVPSIGTHGNRLASYKDPITFNPPPADEPRAEFTDRRSNLWKVVFEGRRGVITKSIDPLGKIISREFNDNYRNLTKVTDQEGNYSTITYTYQAGVQESPTYIKDNVRAVTRPDPNQVSGNKPASVATETYTYVANLSLVNTLQTQNPAGAGTVTRTFNRLGNGNLQNLAYPGTSNRVTGAAQNPNDGFTYDARGEPATATKPRGGIVDITAEPVTGLPFTVKEPDHTQSTQMQYDGMGFVTQSTSPMGGTTVFIRDNLHRVTQKQDPAGDAGVALTSFEYDLTTGQATQITYPNGGQTINQYDQLGRLVQTSVKQTAAITLITTYRYDPEGNLKEVTDPKNNKTTNTFDARNLRTRSERTGSGDPMITTDFTYTDAGRVATEVTGGHQTTYVHTPWGALKTATYPISAITDNCTYNADGSLGSIVRKDGGAFKGGVQYTYDEIGRLVGTSQMASEGTGAHLTTTYGLDLDGNVTEVQDPAGRVYRATYDLAGRLLDSKNASQVIVCSRTYDDNDRITEVKAINPALGSGLTTQALYTYNARNETKTAKDALLNTMEYTYKIAGEVETVKDPQNKTTKYDYNLLSQRTSITRDFGGLNLLTQLDYDGCGNLSSVIDPRAKQTSYTHSSLNRLKSITYPGGNLESWTFDSKGRPATHLGRRGITTTYTYDAMDRVIGEQYVQGTTIGNVLRSYDGASNVTETLDTITQVSHTALYDVFSRLQTKQIILGRTVLGSGGTLWKGSGYTYKPDSQVDEYTNPQGTVFKNSYESAGNGRIQTIEKVLPGPAKIYVTYFHDAAGRRKEALFANAVSTFWDHDVNGRLEKVRSVDSNGKILSSFAYTYNSKDERTNLLMAHLGSSVDYAYDALSRLTSESWTGNSSGNGSDPFTNPLIAGAPGNESAQAAAATAQPAAVPTVAPYSATYHYDGSGNRDTRQTLFNSITTNYVYVYDDESRLTTETVTGGTNQTVTYGYGSPASSPNILTRTIGAQVETYSYDYAERLTGYLRNGGSPANWSYQYLPTGERLNKVNVLGSTNNEEWYYPDGADVTADYAKTTGQPTYTLTSQYVNAGLDSKAARIQASGTELYYMVDGLGSVHRVIDQAQAIQNTVLTTAWGEALPGFGGSVGIADRYGFTQRENDAESGLMQFRARAYDPRIGRFIQNDPLINNRPLKHYAYAANNPVNFVDPMGLDEFKRAFLEGLIEEGKLGSLEQYARWYIHDDLMWESRSQPKLLGGKLYREYIPGPVPGQPKTAEQYKKDSEYNWNKLLFEYGFHKEWYRTAAGEAEQNNESLHTSDAFDLVDTPDGQKTKCKICGSYGPLQFGQVPSNRDGQFDRWFDRLKPKELDALWKDKATRRLIEDKLRNGGGKHEWLQVSRAPTFKRWGLKADDIKRMTTLTKDVKWKNPVGTHGGDWSTTAHNQMRKLIDESGDFEEFTRKLWKWADEHLEGGAGALPEGLRRVKK
jgi:RHS repeat-associated protein